MSYPLALFPECCSSDPTDPGWIITEDGDYRISESGSLLITESELPFNPFAYIPWAHAGWAEDPLWAHPANGQPVPSWRNNSGGGDLVQASAPSQPIWDADALNGRPAVVYDGVDDLLAFNIANIGQTMSLVAVAACTGTLANRNLFGAISVGPSMYVSGSGRWAMNAGTTVAESAPGADNLAHLHTGVFAGAGSARLVDGVVVASGNAGANPYVEIRLGSISTSSGMWQGPIAFWGVVRGDVTAHPNWSLFLESTLDYYELG